MTFFINLILLSWAVYLIYRLFCWLFRVAPVALTVILLAPFLPFVTAYGCFKRGQTAYGVIISVIWGLFFFLALLLGLVYLLS